MFYLHMAVTRFDNCFSIARRFDFAQFWAGDRYMDTPAFIGM